MTGLTFTLRAEPGERLDLSALLPSRLAGLAVSDIERIAIGTTRHPLHVGDVFSVTGAEDRVRPVRHG